MNREAIRLGDDADHLIVRTWCRICGRHALVSLSPHYDLAVIMAHWLDDQIMDHEGHSENGGWGVHWRLDEVLRATFPGRHHENLFPTPKWYPHPDAPSIAPPPVRIVKKNGVDRIL